MSAACNHSSSLKLVANEIVWRFNTVLSRLESKAPGMTGEQSQVGNSIDWSRQWGWNSTEIQESQRLGRVCGYLEDVEKEKFGQHEGMLSFCK